MPGIKAKGIVIKQAEFGEANRMISIFTREYGIIRAAVYGAKSIKSGKGSACQVLSFSEFELTKASGDIYTVASVAPIEAFFAISEDIVKVALSAYLFDITFSALGNENPDEEVLSLLLNTLYAVCYKGIDIKKAKCVYELRMMGLLGYRPQLTKCVKCGSINSIVGFSTRDGGLVCKSCGGLATSVGQATVETLKHILTAEDRQIFSFSVSEEIMEKVEKIAEEYVKVQLDADFQSLLYLKKMMV